MNKKLLATLFLAIGSAASYAQTAPIITAANFNPQVGDAFISIVCDTTNVLPGTTGANVTWNFTGLSPTQTDTGTAVTVASTVAATAILLAQPSTNVAVVTPTASMTTYAIRSTAKLSTTGYYQSATQYAVYTDPLDQLQYPTTYLSTFTDTYAGTLEYGGTSFPESGTVTSTCDGWGTVNLPGSLSYSGVLRVHSSQTYTDNAGLFGGGTFDLETYSWYLPDYHSAVLTISIATGSGFAAGYYNKNVSYAKTQIAKSFVPTVSNIASSLQIFPNPVRNELNVNFNTANDAQVRISMMDMIGREVAVIADKNVQGVQNITYNTTSLPKGLYLVRLQSADETVTRKIVIE